MENEYDDFDFDEFDSTEETGGDDAISATNSTVDAVAALLMEGSEEGEDGEGKDNAKTSLYDNEGETRPKKNRTFNTVELDRHGNRIFDGQQKEQPAAEPQESIHEKQEILYQSQIDEAKQQAQAEWDRVQQAYAKLQEDLHSGEIDLDAFNQQSYALGIEGGRARDAAMTAELQGYKIKEQREAANAELNKLLGDDMWGSKEAREATSQLVHDYVKEMGIEPELLEEVESAAVVRALATAAKNHTLVEEQKATIAKQAAQIRQLKKRGKAQSEKAKKSMGVGAKRDSDYAINEVAKLLMDSGHGRGGR